MTSLTRIAQGVASGRRHGRSRAWSAYHPAVTRARGSRACRLDDPTDGARRGVSVDAVSTVMRPRGAVVAAGLLDPPDSAGRCAGTRGRPAVVGAPRFRRTRAGVGGPRRQGDESGGTAGQGAKPDGSRRHRGQAIQRRRRRTRRRREGHPTSRRRSGAPQHPGSTPHDTPPSHHAPPPVKTPPTGKCNTADADDRGRRGRQRPRRATAPRWGFGCPHRDGTTCSLASPRACSRA